MVLEDGAALIGVLLAAAGTLLSQLTHDGRADAAASVAIGVLLCVVAVAMMSEIGSLLTGESIDPEIVRSIRSIASEQSGVADVHHVKTMTLGPKNVIVALHLVLETDQSAAEATAAIQSIRENVTQRHAMIGDIFVRVHDGTSGDD